MVVVSLLSETWEGCLVQLRRKKGWKSRDGGRTERSRRESILWRGMTVTSSISQRKAISGGVRPGGRGRAIVNM